MKERAALGEKYNDHDLVFACPDGQPMHPDFFSQTFERTVKRLGLRRVRRLGAAYHLAATTGMRRGEVLGVRWQDIDFKAKRLAVRQTVISVNDQVMIGQPKTARGDE